jgi:hypothetical protein
MSVVVDNGGIVMGGTGAVQRPRTKMGAANEPARSVLMRALQASPVKRTWLLGHALENGPNAFSLNIFELPTLSEVLY